MTTYNNYPRLYSLSTIGTIYHYHSDYLFHPLRTDFVGDSGSGKSMIADFLQLIFVANSTQYKSATNENRHIRNIVHPKAYKAYIFLNIEIAEHQYAVIGVHINSSNDDVSPFIIHDGFDIKQELVPFYKPIRYKDLLKKENNEDLILDFEGLAYYLSTEKIGVERHICEKFSAKDYHKILLKHQILPIDLTKSDKTIDSYAQVIRSFSRGKDLILDSGGLKKFIFGDTYANEINAKFKEEIKSIEKDLKATNDNKIEIAQITEKSKKLANLQMLKKQSDETKKVYLKAMIVYNAKLYNEANAELMQEKINQLQLNTEIILLKLKEQTKLLTDFDMAKQNLNTFTDEENKLNLQASINKKNTETGFKEFNRLMVILKQVEQVNQWLLHYKDIFEITENYQLQQTNKKEKKELAHFENILEANLSFFKESLWLKEDYETATIFYQNEIIRLNKEIEILETLANFTNLADKNSLANWAFQQEKAFSIQEWSVLLYFQQLNRQKPIYPIRKDRYLPVPEELFANIQERVENPREEGFWLNLNGVREFITFVDKKIFENLDKEALKKTLVTLQKTVQMELDNNKKEKNNIENLNKAFRDLEISIKKGVDLYLKKDAILNYMPPISIEIGENEFSEIIKIYEENKNEVTKELEQADKSYKTLFELEQSQIKRQKELNDTLIPELNTFFSTHSKEAIAQTITELNLQKNNYIQQLNEAKIYNIYLITNELETQLLEKEVKKILQEKENKSEPLIEIIKELTQKVADLNTELENSKKEYETQCKLLLSKEEIESIIIKGGNIFYPARPGGERDDYLVKETAYTGAYTSILENYAQEEQERFIKNKSFIDLAQFILPDLFKKNEAIESEVISKIDKHLNELNDKAKDFGKTRINALIRVIESIELHYDTCMEVIRRMKRFFNKKAAEITGGHTVTLHDEEATNYNRKWMAEFKREIRFNKIIYTENTLFFDLNERTSLEDMMLKIYQSYKGSLPSVKISDLLNPLSYFTLSFSMKNANGKTHDISYGSTGQIYSAIALLCIARLSVVEEKELKEPIKGIRFMPIDEAEGLGSNYEMLYKIAIATNHQIISMSIKYVDYDLKAHYIYELNGNKDKTLQINHKAYGIFTGDYIYNLSDYYDKMIEL